MAPLLTSASAISIPFSTPKISSRRRIVIYVAWRSLTLPWLFISILSRGAPLGNEGTGLSDKDCAICDFFIYIPQYGVGTASLNVSVAASIVLHHFGVWAGFAERCRDDNKFIAAERPVKHVKRNYCPETEESITEERKCRRENASKGFFDEGMVDDSTSNLLDTLFIDE